jgi:glyoxylase-like metal-dependent hydrolase (beta-lactamase superfamily II)
VVPHLGLDNRAPGRRYPHRHGRACGSHAARLFSGCGPVFILVVSTPLPVSRRRQRRDRGTRLRLLVARLGISAGVILTHLHVDHYDGLHSLPNSEILVNEMEWRRPYYSLPQLYLPWLKPTLFQFKAEHLDGFDRAYKVTTAGDVLILPTPGHTYHHARCCYVIGVRESVICSQATRSMTKPNY